MTTDEMETIVRQLHAQGASERKIARHTKLSRTTVSKILRRKPRQDRHPVKCPVCLYTVVLPCVVCGYRIRKKKPPRRYIDNLYITIIYPKCNDPTPHTTQAEDEWDDEYARRNPWCREA
jgi:hypothetical protein